ncbi:ABC transporter G family member 20 [Mizuhopecten yessoensis]|uniref:ABC transporter G family member 20 n=2 Tax=Mizuhopecten yessoensis TaxID=6573 RepID=A0A210QGE6_MIZYE|nr:ABC transporter G family member 20 [Mizuhopecten yessoensis]
MTEQNTTTLGENAVWARGLSKRYGKKDDPVLQNLAMTVERGSIYGLLGPSGCGKTTLLRCIVGRLSVDRGNLVVLGEKPGTPGHGIPGSLVGYMPQEMALFNKMTIRETLFYFGRIHRMSSHQIDERILFLLQFLTLPDQGRIVDTLSGGQKRRVSFAVALLHEPELLILDEPTVGVDPLLRERIWEHLVKIAGHDSLKTTIIITTHYIEEARQANTVGLMRGGRLLAEEEPNILIQKHHINSLEAVFLKLCQNDDLAEGDDLENGHVMSAGTTDVGERTPLLAGNRGVEFSEEIQTDHIYEHKVITTGSRCTCGLPSGKNIVAQFLKNLTLMKRNIGFLLFEFILPSIQIVLFCLCIGGDPYNLKVAIFNNETSGFSHLFIQNLDNTTINKVMFSDLGSARHCVEKGEAWGLMTIGENFTQDLITRFSNSSHVSNSTLDGGTIKLYLDMTNQQIAVMLQQTVAEAFETFSRSLLTMIGLNPDIAQLPVKLGEPIYGSLDPSFTNFMAPGIILSITFFMATGLTTLAFVVEKKEGLLERSIVSGMTPFEIMLAHVWTQLLVMTVQVGLLLMFALLVFHVPYKGPLIWVIILVLLQGFCGMTLGVIISVVCEEESSAIQLALGSVYPMLLLSGIIWPVEAMPQWLRYISVCLPMTYGADAMRAILSRGWTLTDLPVWRGYLVTLGWGFGLLALGGFILRLRQ